ncbi:MAG TPA: hypothetical protein DFH98_10475, partial [Psychrobacter sp.]|nr:hypothetical protein [Psychrobacter sp.]
DQNNKLPPHLLKPSAWRERIDYMADKPTRDKVLNYIKEVVMPSMMEVSSKFAETGWTTEVN